MGGFMYATSRVKFIKSTIHITPKHFTGILTNEVGIQHSCDRPYRQLVFQIQKIGHQQSMHTSEWTKVEETLEPKAK
jgi:hypothetical protein